MVKSKKYFATIGKGTSFSKILSIFSAKCTIIPIGMNNRSNKINVPKYFFNMYRSSMLSIYKRLSICCTILFFHGVKVPPKICFLASRINQR